jgi:hypothetical protein
MIRKRVSASFILLLLAAHASAAINVVSVSRDVNGNVTGGVPQQSTSSSAGTYNATFNVNNGILDPSGIGSILVSQISTVPNLSGSAAFGSGTAHAQALPSGNTPLGANGDSTLDLYFTVSSSQLYTLNSYVAWINHLPGAFGGSSFVQLWDTTNNLIPHHVQRDSMQPGQLTLNQQLTLNTGILYRLRAESHMFGGSNVGSVFESEADWSFQLFTLETDVPEPATAALTAIAMLALAGLTRRTRRV